MRLLALAAASVVLAGCGGTRTVTETRTVTTEADGPAPRVQRYFGHISALSEEGGDYELRFDPAWFLSGETANAAAAEDGVVGPGEPVPNDNYVVDEGTRLLTYRVARDARVTVLTRKGTGQFGATQISVPELAEIVVGRSSIALFEPLETGVWITVDIDTVESIAQQYRP